MSRDLLVFACLSLVTHTRMLTIATPKTTASNTTTATDMPAARPATGNPDSAVGDGVGVALSAVGVTSTGVLLGKQDESRKPAHGGC